MISPSKRTKEKILNSAAYRGHANYFFPGSMLDSLASDVADITYGVEFNQSRILNAVHVETAGTDDLDKIARTFNVNRRKEEIAYSLASDFNVTVKTTSGESLTSLLSYYGVNLLGLEISDSTLNKRYVINDVPFITSSQTQAIVGVRALIGGSVSNVLVNELSRFVGNFPKLKVTNNFAINSGRDQEADESIKIRILNKIESNLINEVSLNYALLSIVPNYGSSQIMTISPGITEIYIQPAKGISYESKALLAVERELSSYFGNGKNFIVKNFFPVLFNIDMRIIVNNNSDLNAVSAAIKEVIKNYFDNLSGGNSVDLTSLEIVVASIPGVKMISSSGNHFKKVTYTRLEGGATFEYVAMPGELVSMQMNEIPTINSANISISDE